MAAGADWEDVLDECRRQSMTDFDRDRPLWRVTVLEGLPGGKAAVITKLHHAVADGQGALQLGAALVDLSARGCRSRSDAASAARGSISQLSFAELMIRDNVDWLVRTAKEVAEAALPTAVAFLQDPADAIARVGEIGSSVIRFARPPTAQLSPLMTSRSINYHYGAFQLPFGELRGATKASGHSLNDGYLAAVAEAMEEYHRRLGHPVGELNMNMPISLRKSNDHAQNAVSIAHFQINTAEDNPIKLMDGVPTRRSPLGIQKPALNLADQLAEISRFIPFEIVSAAATASDVTASNVPGPPVQVYLAGAGVQQMIPLPPPMSAAVFVALLTYNGEATIGVAMDDAAVGDRELLMECMRDGFSKITGKPIVAWDPLVGRGPRRAASTRSGTAKSATRKSATRKSAPKRAPAKKSPAAEAPAKRVLAKKAAVKRAPAKKASAKKAPAKKAAAKKVPARRPEPGFRPGSARVPAFVVKSR